MSYTTRLTPLTLFDDAGRDVADEFHVEGIKVGRHAVG
jgi:hypothetical protein